MVRVWVCKYNKKKKGFNCPVKIRTVQENGKITVFKQDHVDHDHNPLEGVQRKHFIFSQKVEKQMEQMLEMGVSSRNMRKNHLQNGYFTESSAPDDQVFYSKTSKLRKKLNLDRRTIGLREFEELIDEHKREPEDPDEPYIVKSSEITEDDDGKLRYSVFLSSKSLKEKHMKPGKPWILSLDATYQTNTEDCPLIFFGTSNSEGKFQGIGIVLSSREDKELSTVSSTL